MPTTIAFLRAINVGGRFLKMAALQAHFEALGCEDVRTYINSGNVIFNTRARSLPRLAQTLEVGLERLVGFRSEVFLRTPAQLQQIAQRATAHRAAVPPEGEVNVAFVNAPLSEAQAAALDTLRTALDDFAFEGTEVYWLCRGRQSDSKFSNATFERRLQQRATFRRQRMLAALADTMRADPARTA
jgi:uncharacterized protein (DUF1697 family)